MNTFSTAFPSKSMAVVAFVIPLLLGGLLLLYCRVPAAVVQAEPTPSSDLIIVGLEPSISEAEATALFAEEGLTLVRMWRAFDLAAVRPTTVVSGRAPAAVLAAALQRADSLPIVRFAEPDGLVEAAVLSPTIAQAEPFQPNDSKYPEQWALPLIGMPDGWTMTEGDPSLVIAVLDSGVEITHEDLGTRIYAVNSVEAAGQAGVDDDGNGYVDDIHGWDWIEGDNEANDQFGHGTHVVGTMVASINNGIGIAGMGSRLRILPLRVLAANGSGSISDLLSGMEYARQQGATVLNLSLVLRLDSAAVRQAVQLLYNDGTLIVAATGNYGNQVYWPAVYTETLAVAAVDQNDLHAVFSNAGPQTDVAAPGDKVWSTYLNNGYTELRGTSMATPHVAALAALIWSLRPDWDREAVVEAILSTAVDVNSTEHPGHDDFLGVGRIDAAAALRLAADSVQVAVQLPVGSYLGIGQPLEIPIRLTVTSTTASELPIVGAVIQAELSGPSIGAASVHSHSGRLVSDEDGYAILDLTLPEAAGVYTLTVTGAGQPRALQLEVKDGPLLLSVMPSAPAMDVGGGRSDIGILAYTDDGELFRDPLQVTLRTSLGQFGNGGPTTTTLMTEGQITETLYAGVVAGEAKLTIQVANQTHRSTVLIRPGAPSLLTGPSHIFGLNYGKGAVIDLHLRLFDRYGNQVWRSYPVNFYSLGARFSPESVRAVNGEVATQLSIQSWVTTPQPLWAMIPGTFAIYHGEAQLLSHHLYLPQMMRE